VLVPVPVPVPVPVLVLVRVVVLLPRAPSACVVLLSPLSVLLPDVCAWPTLSLLVLHRLSPEQTQAARAGRSLCSPRQSLDPFLWTATVSPP